VSRPVERPQAGDMLAVAFPSGAIYAVRVSSVSHRLAIVLQERGGRVEDVPHRLRWRAGAWRTDHARGVLVERPAPPAPSGGPPRGTTGSPGRRPR